MKQISYLPLECELKRHRMSKTELQRLTQLSTTTIAKITKNQDISMKVLKIIAEVLNCDINDMVTFNDVYNPKKLIERGNRCERTNKSK